MLMLCLYFGNAVERVLASAVASVCPACQLRCTFTDPDKAICGGCEVRGQCLEYALSLPWDEDWGLWGGISMHERRKMRTRRTAQGIGPAVSWCKKKLHVRTEATTYTGPDGRIECRPCKHAGYLRRKIAQKEAA